MHILIINSGSSSVKFQLFHQKNKNFQLIAKGQAEALNLPNSQFSIIDNQKQTHTLKTPIKDHVAAMKITLQELSKLGLISKQNPIQLIGHRVVHGGEKYTKPTIITPKVLSEIQKISNLAPLHNPANIACIKACQKIFRKIPQVAVFDTSFHNTIAPEAYLYAIPFQLYKKHSIRRYGFHGTNHRYVSTQATKILRTKKLPAARLITVHLGNGCSVTAIKNGKSINTSMGYTPLEGLVMGTRSGDLDPALIPVLSEKLKLSSTEVINFLNKKSGLLGMTEISSDMRTIWAAAQQKNPSALLALSIYSRRIAHYINAYIGFLGGIDAIIFTGGIGENAYYIRQQVANYLSHLNIKLNKSANLKNQLFINAASSKTKVMIIPANEELEIAKQSLSLVQKTS